MKHIKESKFRQQGWFLKSTGNYIILYGDTVTAPEPVNGEAYILAWDNTITQVTTIESNLTPHTAVMSV